MFRGTIESILRIPAELAESVSDLAELTEENLRDVGGLTGEWGDSRKGKSGAIPVPEDRFGRRARE